MYAGNFFLFCGFLALCTHRALWRRIQFGRKNFQRFFVALRFLLLLLLPPPPPLLISLLTTKWPFSCLVLLDCFPFNFNFYCNFLPSFFILLFPIPFLSISPLCTEVAAVVAVVCAFKMINSIKNWNAKILLLRHYFAPLQQNLKKKKEIFSCLIIERWKAHCGCVLFREPERHH